MKKIIAKILRRWADKLDPSKEIQLPALSVKVGDLLLMRAGYQYPKGAQSIDFDRVRCRTTQLLAGELLKRRIILFTINDSDLYVNTIEASIYVKRPKNCDNYEEI